MAETLLLARTWRMHQVAPVASIKSQNLIFTKFQIYPPEDASRSFWVLSGSSDF